MSCKLTSTNQQTIRLGLAWAKDSKKACPARVAKAEQENIGMMHELKLIQTADTL
jgi:hypothetical protein